MHISDGVRITAEAITRSHTKQTYEETKKTLFQREYNISFAITDVVVIVVIAVAVVVTVFFITYFVCGIGWSAGFVS